MKTDRRILLTGGVASILLPNDSQAEEAERIFPGLLYGLYYRRQNSKGGWGEIAAFDSVKQCVDEAESWESEAVGPNDYRVVILGGWKI